MFASLESGEEFAGQIGEVIGLAEEAGEIGAEGIDEFGEVLALLMAQDMIEVFLDGPEVGMAQELGQAGTDEFFLAIVEVDAAVLVDDIADALEVALLEIFQVTYSHLSLLDWVQKSTWTRRETARASSR